MIKITLIIGLGMFLFTASSNTWADVDGPSVTSGQYNGAYSSRPPLLMDVSKRGPIQPGQAVTLPNGQTYVVKVGDSVTKILQNVSKFNTVKPTAQDYKNYNSWNKVYQSGQTANYQKTELPGYPSAPTVTYNSPDVGKVAPPKESFNWDAYPGMPHPSEQ